MTYRELKQALQILGLGERASLAEIRSRHRALVKDHHPDRHDDPEKAARMQKINAAYRLISDYCAAYRFDFGEEEFLEQTPDERLRRQFATDPLWERVDRSD